MLFSRIERDSAERDTGFQPALRGDGHESHLQPMRQQQHARRAQAGSQRHFGRKRFTRAIGFTACLIFGLVCARFVQAQPGVGDVFPDPSQLGVKASLHGKAVLVDFWASWCGPCRASFPALERLYKKFKPAGLQVVGISVDDSPDAMSTFLGLHPVSFPTAHDQAHKLAERLQLKSMPSSFLLDAQGRIHAVHNGFHGAETERALGAEIERMLK